MTTETNQVQRIDVFTSIAMEAFLRKTISYQGFNFPDSTTASLETQQLDEAKSIDVLIARHENLKKLLKAEKPTGIPHLFVLDPDKLAVGDLDAQATLQAFANVQFSDTTETAIAMLPPTSGFTPEGQAAVNLVKETILSETKTTTLESVDALSDWLNLQNQKDKT